MIIYLVGSISGQSYNEVMVRLSTARTIYENMGYTVWSPMTGKDYLRTELKFKKHGYKYPQSTNHAIFERDKWMVQNCDILLADFRSSKGVVSIGSCMELAWGALLEKHIVTILPEDDIHNHAFILEASDIVFNDVGDAHLYMEKFAEGVLCADST